MMFQLNLMFLELIRTFDYKTALSTNFSLSNLIQHLNMNMAEI